MPECTNTYYDTQKSHFYKEVLYNEVEIDRRLLRTVLELEGPKSG